MNKDLQKQLYDADNAIRQCIAWANGRQYEWGNRAENAFQFLENYESNYMAVPPPIEEPFSLDNSKILTMID